MENTYWLPKDSWLFINKEKRGVVKYIRLISEEESILSDFGKPTVIVTMDSRYVFEMEDGETITWASNDVEVTYKQWVDPAEVSNSVNVHVYVKAKPGSGISQNPISGLEQYTSDSPVKFEARHPSVSKLPGVTEMVKCPRRGTVHELEDVIIFLNDSAKWTRHQIADWLETLDLDLRFGQEPDHKKNRILNI